MTKTVLSIMLEAEKGAEVEKPGWQAYSNSLPSCFVEQVRSITGALILSR